MLLLLLVHHLVIVGVFVVCGFCWYALAAIVYDVDVVVIVYLKDVEGQP
jgi:hypothetical protein